MNNINFKKINNLIKNLKEICILTNLTSKDPEFRLDNFFEFIEKINNSNNKIIINIFERKFKDTDTEKINLINTNLKKINQNINLSLITTNQLKKHKVNKFNELIFENLFIYENLFKSEITFILTEAKLHIHHSKKYLFSCIDTLVLASNLNLIEYENYNKKELIKILRDEINLIFKHIKNLNINKNKFYGILDGTNIKITNEHIPFFYKKKQIGIFQGKNLEKLHNNLLTLLN